jgi:hypothetical protein
MKKITYSQLVIELDKLFFSGKISSLDQAEDRYDTIEAYLEAVGWTWDDIMNELINDGANKNERKSLN